MNILSKKKCLKYFVKYTTTSSFFVTQYCFPRFDRPWACKHNQYLRELVITQPLPPPPLQLQNYFVQVLGHLSEESLIDIEVV